MFYLGAGATANKLNDIVVQGTAFPDIDSASWKVFAGFRPISAFAVEADYLDLGSGKAQADALNFIPDCFQACNHVLFQSDAKVFAAYALGFLPIPVPFLDIYGKAGLASSTLTTNGASNRGTGFAWGVGVQAHISMFGARLEYEDLKIPNSSGAKVASLSVFVSFL